MLAAQLGGTPVPGQVRTYADGHRVQVSDAAWARKDRGLLLTFDARASVGWHAPRWFALYAQAGLTNWNSGYLRKAGHKRSTFFSFGLAPELRLPLGQCRRCASVFMGPRASYVLSHLDGREPYASVKPRAGLGQGYTLGGRVGVDIPVPSRVAVKLELGFDKTYLRHDVDYGELGSEKLEMVILRGLFLAGVSWAP